ncbi:MAG: hypothetical protein SGBAC_013179, partial [Bacillariaceae sp.]
FFDYAIYFDDTLQHPYSQRRVSDGDGDVYYGSFGCREGSTTDLGLLFFNDEACQVECQYSLPMEAFADFCEQTEEGNIRFELPVGDFPTDTRFFVGNIATDFPLTCAQEVPLRSCADQNLDFFADFLQTNVRLSPWETDQGFSEAFTCNVEPLDLDDAAVLQWNNDDCATECIGRFGLKTFCDQNLGEDFSIFVPGDFSFDSRVYVGFTAEDFDLECGNGVTINTASVSASAAPSVQPSSEQSISSHPTNCAIPAFDDYAVYFDASLETPYRRRTVPTDNQDDYTRYLDCQEGISTDMVILYFDDERCLSECKYRLPLEKFENACSEDPSKGVRALLPGGALPGGTIFYQGHIDEDLVLECEQEASILTCGNQNYAYFARFFDDADSYERFNPGDTDTGIDRTFSCRADAITDLAILLYNMELCFTECLYSIPFDSFGSNCKENPESEFSFFIPGQFTGAQRVTIGNVANDFSLKCGGQLSIIE